MLDGMRRMSQGLVGRIIMGLVMGFISLSFAVWGIGNIFVNYGTGTVASVGAVDITSDMVRQAYQTQLQNLQRQARRAITNDQARAMGLDRQVLGQLIANAALDGKAQALGMALSDKDIAQKILVDPTFFGPTGKFDQGRFNDLLRDAGFSEQTFLREQRQTYLRQAIADAVAGDIETPLASLDAIHRFRDEIRSIDFITLPTASVGAIADPDEATLKAWFETRKDSFRAPEFRKLVALSISPTTLADPASVSDADAQKLYEQVKGQRFGSAATRQVEQAVFPDEATAKQASEKIKAGMSLADVAAEFKISVADLGKVTKGDIFDKAIADAVFTLPEGGVSEPIKSQFGFAITRVIAASPESVKPFAEVAGELKSEIARERAKKKLGDLRDKVEDERTSGKALDEAASAAGLKATVIDAIDQNGLDKAGLPVGGLVEKDALLRAAFASNVGVDNETLNSSDGGYVWFEVANVEPARDQTLDEVKDKALAAWRNDEITRRLTEKTNDLVKKIDGGATIEEQARELGLEVQHVADVKRIGTSSVSQSVVARVFGLPVGKAGAAAGDAGGRVVFKILDSSTPPLDVDSDVMKSVRDQLKQSYFEDVLTEYLQKIQSDAGVKINEAALRAATGGADASDQ